MGYSSVCQHSRMTVHVPDDSPSPRMPNLIQSIDREDQTSVCKHEVDVVLVYHPPNITEPRGYALHRLFKEFRTVGPLLNKRSLRVAMEFVEEGIDFSPLRLDVEDRDACVPPLHLRRARKYLLAFSFVHLVKKRYELLLDDGPLDVRR